MQLNKIYILIFILLSSVTMKAQGIYIGGPKDTSTREYRLNLFVGVSPGVTKGEISALLNVDTKDVKYVQLAGLGNIVYGNVEGVQAAGFINTAGGNFRGVQAAGFMNTTKGESNGIQAAGFLNVNGGKMTGVQAAGFANYAKSINGIQSSGFLNAVDSSVIGMQYAGFLNYAHTLTGIQVSGFVNCAQKVKKGIMIAPFNFADTCDGLPIGFFTFVRKGGYHKLEISSDEIFQANISFRSGVKRFHNIFSVGLRPQNSNNVFWTMGYGVGTSIELGKRLDLDIDLLTNHINNSGYRFYDYRSDNYKLYAGLNWQFINGCSVAFGPTLNFYVVSADNKDLLNDFNTVHPGSFYYQKVYNDNYLKAWVGGKIAIRFF